MFSLKETALEFGKNVGTKIKLTKRSRPEAKSLDGQVVVITGANRGMGRLVAEDCAVRGARVILACRDMQAANKAIEDIKSTIGAANLAAYELDLASFASVHSFVGSLMQNESKIDVLVNNAAIVTDERKVTSDGHETMIQVNYYSPVMLTLLLAPYLEKTSSDARIITVGALGHTYVKDIAFDDMESEKVSSFSPFMVYLHSKLALMMFVRELAVRRSANRGARVYCVDPGVSPTDLAKNCQPKNAIASKITFTMFQAISRSVQQSADSIMKVILMERDGYNPRVYYFLDGEPKALSSTAADDMKTAKLWEVTSEIVPSMKSMKA